MPVENDQIRSKIVDTLGQIGCVLDVGCGNCDLVRFLAGMVAEEAVGIDINTDAIREHVHSDSDGAPRIARCHRKDAQHMDGFSDARFDAVVSVHALHEIADPNAALQETNRVLKPGGVLLVADFTAGETRWNETYFTPAQVRAMLKKAGFIHIQVEKVAGEHFMFASATK